MLEFKTLNTGTITNSSWCQILYINTSSWKRAMMPLSHLWKTMHSARTISSRLLTPSCMLAIWSSHVRLWNTSEIVDVHVSRPFLNTSDGKYRKLMTLVNSDKFSGVAKWNGHRRSVLRPTRAKMSLLVNSWCQRRPRNPCDWWWLQSVGIRNIPPKTQSFESPSSDGRYASHVQHAGWYKTLSINNNMGNVAIHSGPQVDWPQSSLAWNTWSHSGKESTLTHPLYTTQITDPLRHPQCTSDDQQKRISRVLRWESSSKKIPWYICMYIAL